MTEKYKLGIAEDIYNKCMDFANNSVDTSVDAYAKRGQTDILKIRDDIRGGKLGEYLAFNFLSKSLPNLFEPDFNIYDKKDKSWDVDLKDLSSNIRIAVKTQDIRSMLQFEKSWVFQKTDTGIFGKIDENHYVCFVSINTPKRFGEIEAVVKVQWLHDNNLFKEMKNAYLRNNKFAVYYEDLKPFKDQLWQL